MIRIVPFYRAVNAAKLLGLALLPALIAANPTVSNAIFSLLFPLARTADGIAEAFYGAGWTLNLELLFYALFALALLMRIRPAFVAIPALLAGTVLSQVKPESWPAVAHLLSPMLLHLVWGILIGAWDLARRRLPVAVSVVLIVVGDDDDVRAAQALLSGRACGALLLRGRVWFCRPGKPDRAKYPASPGVPQGCFLFALPHPGDGRGRRGDRMEPIGAHDGFVGQFRVGRRAVARVRLRRNAASAMPIAFGLWARSLRRDTKPSVN